MNSMPKLDDQCALVTGASRGIGRAIAETLARAGCNVAISSRSLNDCQAVAAEIAQRHPVQTVGLQADVSDFEDVHKLFQQLRAWSSDRLDILVCNAGYPMRAEIWNTPLHDTPADKLAVWYLDVLATDAMGSVYCTFEAIPLMAERRSGSIIYISSTPALEGYQGGPYTMAKAAVLGMMRDVAREYGKNNIRANALALGNIQTPATFEQLDEPVRKALAAEAPLQRWGMPDEVGNAALFLASDLSSFITGQVLVVDGGTLRR
jgi:NAD(P)-dependent dehydrogenase (short-subunit alcohol dehydrogenase family)